MDLSELFSSPIEKDTDSHLDNSDFVMKERCRNNLELFCKYYFPDIFTSEFCDFHKDVFSTIEDYIFGRKKGKKYMVRAAPRGHGKSQIISMATPLFCICYGYKKNILIVSDTNSQAEQFIGDIKIELEDNERLIADFGDLVGTSKWRAGEIVTSTNIHCVGKGAGQKLRGTKYNNTRPDLIIVDDLENDESVETKGQRDKLFIWFTKALLKCGDPNVNIIYIGTILSYNSLLNRVLTEPQYSMWDRKIYKAIYKFSDSPLWDEWETLILEADIENNKSTASKAYELYEKNKKEMLDGVECLWKEREEDYYYNLMIDKIMDEESFNSEHQNDPITDNMRDFKLEWIENNMYDELPEITEVYGGVDPTVVVSKRSDTSAIILVGRGVDNKLYVIEADVKKRSAEQVIDDMVYIIANNYDMIKGFIVETNAMQQFFANTVKQKFLDMGMYVPWIEIKHPQGVSKERRIKSMIPYIKNGFVKFHSSQKRLLSQLKNYPKDNDDGVDCLQTIVEQMVGITATSSFSFGNLINNNESNVNIFKKRW